MNQLAHNTTFAQSEAALSFDSWLAQGRMLIEQRRNVDWLIGDWIAEGKERYPEQFAFDLLADNLGIAPKRLKDIAQAVTAFPPHMRDTSLTIEHHASVATLPVQEALPLLKQAKESKWTPEQIREQVVRLSHADQVPVTLDDDALEEAFIRHWNRLPRRIRISVSERIAEANGEEIEP